MADSLSFRVADLNERGPRYKWRHLIELLRRTQGVQAHRPARRQNRRKLQRHRPSRRRTHQFGDESSTSLRREGAFRKLASHSKVNQMTAICAFETWGDVSYRRREADIAFQAIKSTLARLRASARTAP